jgi:phage terminase small subunit
MQSPHLTHLNQQVATMMRIATEFGFTPASRSRIFTFDQKNSLLLNAEKSDEAKALFASAADILGKQ